MDKLNIFHTNKTYPVAYQHNNSIVLKADTGASKHYIKQTDKNLLSNITPCSHAQVTLPNKMTIQASTSGSLPLPVNSSAKTAYILPGLTNSSLLSIGQLCDDDCTAIFTKTAMTIYKNAKVLLTGVRNPNDGLWDITIPTLQEIPNQSNTTNYNHLQANAIITKDIPKYHLANYLHACAFSPTLTTFQKAISNGHFITWPSIEKINFKKFLHDQTATHLGHLDQERSNLQSTKIPLDVKLDFFPEPDIPNKKQYVACSKIIPFTPKELSYGDLTGSFPYTSSRGNKYLYVMYDYDSNAILVHPLKTRQATEITAAWTALHQRISQHGHEVKHFILDNEFSNELKQALKKNKISYQLVPPNVHRRNAAERAIKTFKAHFLAGLATCDPDFPITEWDRLLEQAEMTLNMLRTSRCHPKLSAFAYLSGPHDFRKNPLAPPGTKVIIHKKPTVRKTWGYHGEPGWYVGPAFHHYRCFKCFVPATAKEIIADTVKFIPKKLHLPQVNMNTYLQLAVEKIIKLLETNIQQHNHLKITNNYEVLKSFKQVAHTLHPPPLPQQHTSATPRVNTTLQQMLRSLQRNFIKASPTIGKHPFPKQYPEQIPIDHQNIQPIPRVKTKNFLGQQALPNRLMPPIRHNLVLPIESFLHNKQYEQQLPQSVTSIPNQATPQLYPSNHINHIFDAQGKKVSLDKLITQQNTKEIWIKALNNELGRLSNGYKHNNIAGTQTLRFIKKQDVPNGRKITYSNFVCDVRPLKKEMYRVRMTVGGDRLEYFDDTASPTATLLDTKLILNSTISDHKNFGSKFCSIDIKDFFLQTMLDVPEYIRIHKRYFSTEFLSTYQMHHLPDKDGFVYCEINKGMYGLKQAAILAYNQLVKRLAKHGYFPMKSSNGLWKHKTNSIMFALCVDDFGVKYNSKQDLDHLIDALKQHYEITIDMEGKNFCGLTLEWHYNSEYVDISMPGYVAKKLKKFNHPIPSKPQYAPHKWLKPAYGKRLQYAPPPDKSNPLNDKETKQIQSICGSFLYYARAVDPTILPALNEIATQQSKPTSDTKKKTHMLMDYLCTYPNAKLRFYAGTMKLAVDSDAAYLVLPNAKSRVAGHFYLEAKPFPNKAYPGKHNAPLLTECYTLKNVVSSAAEAECGGIFHNCIVAIGIRNALEEMGHPQGQTRITTDNTTATSFVHSAMRTKRSKSWDMKYNWLRERTAQQQFEVKWEKGATNQADYFTKHHAPRIHKALRHDYVLKGFSITDKKKSLTPVQTCKGVLNHRITPLQYNPTSVSTYVHSKYKQYVRLE